MGGTVRETIGFYNLCRVHGSLRVTPAMEAGITDHIWSIEEMLAKAATLDQDTTRVA